MITKKTITWSSVKEYEGLYQVSNCGLVRSLDRVINCGKVGDKTRRGKILKPFLNCHGYLVVGLADKASGRKNKTKPVHRVVAEALITNDLNLKCVNHIDGNKKNNDVKNLEWCTLKQNSQHSVFNFPEKRIHNLSPIKGSLSKFTEEKLLTLFTLIEVTTKHDIADIFKVSSSTIQNILKGRVYKKHTKDLIIGINTVSTVTGNYYEKNNNIYDL
jgi:hypothetical protein